MISHKKRKIEDWLILDWVRININICRLSEKILPYLLLGLVELAFICSICIRI